MKQEVREVLLEEIVEILSGEIGFVIKTLKEWKKEFEGYKEIFIDFDAWYEEISAELIGVRLETDEEYKSRIEIEEKELKTRIKRKETRKKNSEKKKKEMLGELQVKYDKIKKELEEFKASQ